MRKAIIKFKIVTPCILGGADQKKAELRAPSIRGQLRYWFRVLGGSPEEEKKIFGGIGKNDEGRASAVVVRVKTPKNEITKLSSQTMENINTAGRFDYFLWPLRNQQDARGIITEDQSVEIQIMQRRVQGSRELDIKVVKAFLLLGALGTRSRRAYGSIYPESVIFDDAEWNFPKTEEEFKIEIPELLSSVNCKVLKLESANSARDAIQTCADALKRFRCGKSSHGAEASEWGKNDHDLMPHNRGDKIYRAAIALPHQTKYYDAEIDGYERLASPVVFKIIKLEDKFIPIIIFLKDSFVDEGVKVRLSKKGQYKDVTLSNDLLNEMLNENSRYWDGATCLFE